MGGFKRDLVEAGCWVALSRNEDLPDWKDAPVFVRAKWLLYGAAFYLEHRLRGDWRRWKAWLGRSEGIDG